MASGDRDAVRACILSGEIRTPGVLWDVISFLAHAAWWGELVVVQGEATRSLYFDEGHVVGAESSAADERLGEVLCRHGALTREQVTRCGEHATDRDLRFGEAAVDLGFLTHKQLFELMPRQVEDIFFGLGASETGQFAFLEGFHDGDLSFRQKRSADGLLLDAIRRMDEKRCFASRVPSDDHIPVRATDGLPPADDPFGIFEAIDGTRTVAEVAKSVGVEALEVTRALFRHVQTGHATMRPPRLGMRKTIEVYNEAVVVLMRELEAVAQGDAVRAQLAGFAQRDATEASFVKLAADGTVDADDAVEKVAREDNPAAVEDRVAAWLYDYASYAVFLARPHLERGDAPRDPSRTRLSRRFDGMLPTVIPASDPSDAGPEIPAAARSPRVTMPVAASPPGEARVGAEDGGQARVGTSTQRIRKASHATVPGVDPSRTQRMAPVSVDALVMVRKRTVRSRVFDAPAVAPAPPSSTRGLRPAFVLPEGAPAVRAAPPDPSQPSRSRPLVVALVGASCVALGVLVGARSQLFREGGVVATPAASSGGHATTLVVVCDPACASLYVDGHAIAPPFEPLPLPPGSHEVVAHRAGYAQQLKHVTLTEGQSQAVSFRLVPHAP